MGDERRGVDLSLRYQPERLLAYLPQIQSTVIFRWR